MMIPLSFETLSTNILFSPFFPFPTSITVIELFSRIETGECER
jgi:hypothetical protein